MNKVDVIRMIASMPDDTQVFFNNNGKMTAIDNATYDKKEGRIVFGMRTIAAQEAHKSKGKNKKVLPGV